jgi:secondary thiamine-phosphate synthase enzyme
MKISNKTIELQTKEQLEFIDVTNKVKEFVKESQIRNGIVNVQIMHTSAGLIVNENEPLLIEDFKKSINEIAPPGLNYQHDNLNKRTVNVCPDECINGHSHCKAIHFLTSVTLNLINGEIQFGQWQRIFLVELDKSRKRRFQIQIIGE